jgi:hypothetical protein
LFLPKYPGLAAVGLCGVEPVLILKDWQEACFSLSCQTVSSARKDKLQGHPQAYSGFVPVLVRFVWYWLSRHHSSFWFSQRACPQKPRNRMSRNPIAFEKNEDDRGVNDICIKYPFTHGVYQISGITKTREREEITMAD